MCPSDSNSSVAPSGFHLHSLAQSPRLKGFVSPIGTITYHATKRAYVVAGDPVGNSLEEQQAVLAEFMSYAQRRNKYICGYYFSEDFVKSGIPFTPIKVGVTRSLDLEQFNLKGFKNRDIRRALNKGEKDQLSYTEITNKLDSFEKLKELEQDWLSTKGPEVFFILSRLNLNDKHSRWFSVTHEGQLIAFVSILAFHKQKKYYIDQMIQHPQGHKFGLDFLLSQLILQLKQEGIQELDFGLCAFQKVPLETWLQVGLRAVEAMGWPYDSRGLYNYKKKFTDKESNAYLIFDKNKPQILQAYDFFTATY